MRVTLSRVLPLAVAALLLPTRTSAQPPDISGGWVLNYELSDDPQARAPESVGAVRPDRGCCDGRGGFGGGGIGATGRRSGGLGVGRREREGPSLEELDRLRATVADQLTAPRRMTIEVDDDRREILLSYGDGRYVRLVPDDKEHAGISGSSQITRKAKWEGDALVAEVRFSNGQKVEHRLELRLAGEQLVVTTRLEPRGSQDEIRLRRVYDATGS